MSDDDLDSYVAQQMADPEFARAYAREDRKHARYLVRRLRFCQFGWHRIALTNGIHDYCACGARSIARVV